MRNSKHKSTQGIAMYNRREFLKTLALTGAVIGAGAMPVFAQSNANNKGVAMKSVQLGKLKVSQLGLGCMGMSYGYGKAKDENAMINRTHKAYDLAITFFDTA